MENVLFVSISCANNNNVCAAGILKVLTRYGFVVSKRDLLITLAYYKKRYSLYLSNLSDLLTFDRLLQSYKRYDKDLQIHQYLMFRAYRCLKPWR